MEVGSSRWVLLAGLLAAVPGLVKVVKNDSRHTSEPSGEWGASAAAWNGGLRDRWGHVQQVMLHDYRPPNSSTHQHTHRHEAIYLHPVANDSGLVGKLPYTPLRYISEPVPTASRTLHLGGWREVNASVTFTTAAQSRFRNLLEEPLRMSYSESIKTTNWKHCQFNYRGSLFGQARCTRYRVLRKLCVLFDHNEEGLWLPVGLCPKGLLYDIVKVGRHGAHPSSVVLPQDVVFEARALRDPAFAISPTHPAVVGESQVAVVSFCVAGMVLSVWALSTCLVFTLRLEDIQATAQATSYAVVDAPIGEGEEAHRNLGPVPSLRGRQPLYSKAKRGRRH